MVWLAVRTAGIFLIFAAGSFLGDAMEYGLKRQWLILREFCELLRYMEREMVVHHTPLDEALRLAAGSGMREIREVLEYAADRVERQEGASFQEIWEDAVTCCLKDGVLRAGNREPVCDIWTAFCNQDTVMQKTMLEKQESHLAGLCRDAEQEYRAKAGLYRRLGAAGGVFLIILLL